MSVEDVSTARAAVRMHPWERDIAMGIAGQILRALQANPRGHYMTGVDPTGPDAYRARWASILCEMGVAKHLNMYPRLGAWLQYVDHWDDPDVGRNIEVRRVEATERPSVIVRRKDVNARRIIVVASLRDLTVLIHGAIDSAVAWHLGEQAHWSRDAKIADGRHLLPFDKVRKRRETGEAA